MNTKAKSNSVMTTLVEGSVLSITVLGVGEILFDADKASADNNERARMHGWTQRIADAAALKAPVRPQGISESQWQAMLMAHRKAKYEAMSELASYYEGGDVPWKRVATGGAESGLLFTALCRLKPNRTVQQIKDFLDSRSDDQMKLIRANAEVIEMMNKIRLERAPKVDTSGALDDLEEMEGELDSEIAELIRE
jgi:hypothetical protein